MSTTRYQIVHYRYESRPASRNLLTVEELARLARLHPDMVDSLIGWGLVDAVESEPDMLFEETMDLLDRIDELEREVAWLHKQV